VLGSSAPVKTIGFYASLTRTTTAK
jgi:hypothetical protein